ncbi:YdcF family protein [Lactobacillus sp. PV037]|nr:YdcF family protein [Lactobacillus sp. PV037]QNQ84392.1 YdcF family protein [Lactobacillus sp. PV037]
MIIRILNFSLHNQVSLLTFLVYLTFAIFIISWLIEPRRSINAVFFTAFVLSFALWCGKLLFSQKNTFLTWSFGLIVLGMFILIFILVIFSWAFFLWNAYFVWKYESHTLPNLLTLFSGIGLMLIWILIRLHVFKNVPDWVNILLSGIVVLAFYLLIIMYNFLINLTLYQFVPRHYKQDYLIVLGAGLVNGKKVSRLLGARIDRAIAFSYTQYDKGHPHPKFIMSGGKGSDEKVSEASAMRDYAINRGIAAEDILLEDRSKNTYENMLYSKEVAIKDFGSKKFHAKFFTNNYHLFRAGLYAKKAHLHANGVGAPTRLYYLPNAIIREFVGIFVMHKQRHFVIMGVITLIFVLLAILSGIGYIK